MAEVEAWLLGMIQTPAWKFRRKYRKYRNLFHKKTVLLSLRAFNSKFITIQVD